MHGSVARGPADQNDGRDGSLRVEVDPRFVGASVGASRDLDERGTRALRDRDVRGEALAVRTTVVRLRALHDDVADARRASAPGLCG